MILSKIHKQEYKMRVNNILLTFKWEFTLFRYYCTIAHIVIVFAFWTGKVTLRINSSSSFYHSVFLCGCSVCWKSQILEQLSFRNDVFKVKGEKNPAHCRSGSYKNRCKNKLKIHNNCAVRDVLKLNYKVKWTKWAFD